MRYKRTYVLNTKLTYHINCNEFSKVGCKIWPETLNNMLVQTKFKFKIFLLFFTSKVLFSVEFYKL